MHNTLTWATLRSDEMSSRILIVFENFDIFYAWLSVLSEIDLRLMYSSGLVNDGAIGEMNLNCAFLGIGKDQLEISGVGCSFPDKRLASGIFACWSFSGTSIRSIRLN